MRDNRYEIIVRGNFSRYACVYFVSHKSDSSDAFETILVGRRVEDIPRKVLIVGSYGGREFNEGKFGKLCRERNIKQELTAVDNPEYNGVAERGLAVMEPVALAARIHASELFRDCNVPEEPPFLE